MLYLQAFDYQSGTKIPYRDLDYDRLEAWLARILELDPLARVILLAARAACTREVPVEAKQRSMLEFIYRQFLLDPNRRWPWLCACRLSSPSIGCTICRWPCVMRGPFQLGNGCRRAALGDARWKRSFSRT